MADRTRPILKLARVEPTIEVSRLKDESDWHYAARCASIRALGERWQRHPAYPSPARHSYLSDVWSGARAEFLDEIARLGATARASNPAYLRAQAVRNAIGGA